MLTLPIVPIAVVVVRIIVVVSKCRFAIDCAVCIDSIIDYRHFPGHRLPLSLSLVHGGKPFSISAICCSYLILLSARCSSWQPPPLDVGCLIIIIP